MVFAKFIISTVLFLMISCCNLQETYKPDTSKFSAPRGTKVFTPDSAGIAQNYNALYAIALDWTEGEITIHSIKNYMKIKNVAMLGSDEKLAWSVNADGLKITLPLEEPCEYAYVFKINLKN